MNKRMTCPECGAVVPADAPRGLCPGCLGTAALGLLSDAALPGDTQRGLPRSFGDYELIEEIARGGMGIVYRARQVSHDRLVALKMILAGELAGEAETRRFRAEGEAAASLHHPNIVEIYEVGEHQGQHYYSMKLVEGASLAQRVGSADGILSNDETATLMAKVARAIHHAHQIGLLHRDLKPGNILIDAQGEPHVTDFGLARRMATPSDLTLSGMVLGSPSFMAPEQASEQSRHLTTAADVFSLGAVMYYLLTGRPPFTGSTPIETVRHLLDGEPATPRTLNSKIDRDLETICLKCLEKSPQRRYGSAEALAEDLERWLRHEPIQARTASYLDKVAKWARRNPAAAVLACLALLAAVLGVGGITWHWREAEAARLVAEREEKRARVAEQDATEKLREAYLAQAHANHLTDEPGRRFRSLEILTKAAAIRPGVDLRDEAVAAMACTDLCVLETNSPTGSRTTAAPDDAFARYAVDMPGGEISIRRPTDHGEIMRLPAAGSAIDFLLPLSHTGRWLAARYRDGCVRLWDLDNGKIAFTETVANAVQSVTFRPDDRRAAIADGQGEVRIVALDAGRIVATYPMAAPPARVAYSPDGRRLAVTGRSGTVAILDAETGVQERALAHREAPTGLDWHPDNRRLATTCHDRLVRIWDTETGELLHALIGHGEEVHHVAFHPEGDLLLSGGWDGVNLWDVASGNRRMILPVACGYVRVSPDGRRFFGKTYHAAEFIMGELAHDSPVRSFGSKEASDQPRPAAFSPGDSMIAYLDTRHLRWFETQSGRELGRLERGDLQNLHFDAVSNLWTWTRTSAARRALRTFPGTNEWQLGLPELMSDFASGKHKGSSPDGRFFASLKGDKAAFFETEPLRLLTTLKPVTDGIAASISPEGNQISLGCWHSDKVWIWHKRATGTVADLQHSLTNPAAFCGTPAFARDGKRMVIHWGSSIAMIDRVAGTPLWSQTVDDLPVYDLSPDGRMIAVRIGKRLVRLLEAERGTVIATFTHPNGMPVRQILFSGDGAHLAVVSDSVSELFIWDLARLRRELARLGLDWSAPPMVAPAKPVSPGAVRLTISEPTTPAAVNNTNAATAPLDLSRIQNMSLSDALGGENPANNLAALSPGIHHLGGTDFAIAGRLQLRGKAAYAGVFPAQADEIPVNRSCRRLHFLCATVCAAPRGALVGSFELHQADGGKVEVPLVYGENVADWWGCDSAAMASDPEPVWTGQNALTKASGCSLRLFKVTWTNSAPETVVRSLTFNSTQTESAPFVLAITVE